MPRERSQEAPEGINLKPAMNLILIIIPLLLTSMETLKIAVINVATPQIGPALTAQAPDQKPEEQPLKLTVALTDKGITVFAKGSVIENKDDPLGPTIPKIDGDDEDPTDPTKKVPGKVHDYAKLQELLSDLKNENPNEENVTIQAEANTKYRYIIRVMDATREKKEGDKKKALFPNVVLSAGLA